MILKKGVLLLFCMFVFFACEKNQRRVNKFEGLWKVSSYEAEWLDSTDTYDLVDEVGFSFLYNFFECELGDNSFCEYEITRGFPEGSGLPELLGYPDGSPIKQVGSYRVSGDWLFLEDLVLTEFGEEPLFNGFSKFRIRKIKRNKFVIEEKNENYRRTITAIPE